MSLRGLHLSPVMAAMFSMGAIPFSKSAHFFLPLNWVPRGKEKPRNLRYPPPTEAASEKHEERQSNAAGYQNEPDKRQAEI
jgi:hypothetical protein